MAVPSVRANFVALWVETVLYGGYLVLFAASLYTFLYKKGHGKARRSMLFASVLMFFLITSHIICNLTHAIKAFTTDSDPLQYYMVFADSLNVAKCVLYYAISIVGDAIVVYRCWIVWNGRPVIMVLPCTLYLATIVAGAVGIKYVTQLKTGEAFTLLNTVGIWSRAFFSLSLVTNGLSTLLIASRIWLVLWGTQSNSGLWRVSMTVIESAALYSLTLLVMILASVTHSSAGQRIALDALPSIVGLVFESIVVLVGLGLSPGSNTDWHGRSTVSSLSSNGKPTPNITNVSLEPIRFNATKSDSELDSWQDSSQVV